MKGVIVFGVCLLLAFSHRATTAEPDKAEIVSAQIAMDGFKDAMQGHYCEVSVRIDSLSEPLDSLTLCIAYAQRVFKLLEVRKGDSVAQHNWGNFHYSVEAGVQTDQPEPISILRISAGVSGADSTSGAGTPLEGPGELAVLKFLLTSDATYGCTIAPLRFIWETCDDNVLFMTWESLRISADHVYEAGHLYATLETLHDLSLIDERDLQDIRLGGPGTSCSDENRTSRFRLLNGYVDLDGDCWLSSRGDVDLNGWANERHDLELLIDYLFQGAIVFDIALRGQIAASDANGDHVDASIADVLYMTRVVNETQEQVTARDEERFIWSAPSEPWREWCFSDSRSLRSGYVPYDTVMIHSDDDQLLSDIDVPLGGIYAIFSMADSSGSFEVQNNSSLKMQYGRLGDEVRVLLFPGVDSLTGPLPAGKNGLFSIRGDLELEEMQASDYNGNLLYVAADWKGRKIEFPEKKSR